jgi:Holliday junction resolvasome RuvABC endonuclease subunit
MIVAGIDYSMTSPAICIHSGAEWSIKNCKFFFRTDRKKMEPSSKQVHVDFMGEWKCQEERFFKNAAWAQSLIIKYQPEFVVIEGYAMGAKGRVFHIGEHTGVLKHYLWAVEAIHFTPPPTVVKKFATGKGNANKDAMEVAFEAETKFNMRAATGQSLATNSPSNDIIDAYYMAKFGFFNRESLFKSGT